MSEPNANGNPQAGEPNAPHQPQAGTSNPSTPQAGDSNNNNNQDQPKLTKEEFDRLARKAHEANNEAKNLRDRLRALEVEKEQGEAQKLKEQGEFKTLYEQTEAKVKEFEPVVEENRFLRDYAMKQLEATIKDWPEEALKSDPGKKASLQARLSWIENMAPLVTKLQGQTQQARQVGVFRSPTPISNQNGPKTAEDYYKDMKAGRPF